MKKIIIGLLLVGSITSLFAQSTREVKSYFDYYKTRISSIEHVTDDMKLHGVQKYYYKNGDLRDLLNFKFDKKEGLQKVFFHNGKIKYANNYKDGQFHGETKTYDYDNEKYYLFSKGIFENGKSIEFTKYYSNGNKWEYTVSNGICNQWYENGKKAMEYTFVNGLNHGETTVWNQDGKLILKGNYKNNKEDGKWEYYDTDGKIIRTEYMKMGKNSGQWKIFYDKDFKPVTKKSDAEYYRIIDYNSNSFPGTTTTIPKAVFDYSNTHFVYKTTDYYITGEKQWEGYIEDDNGESLDFRKKVFIEVGEAKFYHKNGKLSSTGIKGHNGGKYNEASSVPIKTWYFYDSNGEIESANIYEWGKMRGRYYYSKLKQTITGDQVRKEEAEYKSLIQKADKLLIDGSLQQAIELYNDALKMMPDQQYPKDKIVEANQTIKNKKRAIENARQESIELIKKGNIKMKEVSNSGIGKRRSLWNAYVIIQNTLNDKMNSSSDYFIKLKYAKKLNALYDKMIELQNQDTKELEKLLKKEKDYQKIMELLGL